MLNPLVRSLVSAVAAACFALITSTGGVLPVCSGAGSAAGDAQHSAPEHAAAEHAAPEHAAPEHPAGHHGAPAGSQGCVVHLCCAHLHVPSPAGWGSERLIALSTAAGFVPSTDLPIARTPHTLPFALGPPAPLV